MVIGIYKQVASDIMTKHVATIRTRDTIHYALLLMAENDLSALPVVDQVGKCVGMITQRDIISMTREKDVEDTERAAERPAELLFGGVALDEVTNERVDELMTQRVVTITPDDPVTVIADRMLETGVHHLPVVNDEGDLLGIVSTMDILASLRTPVQAP